MSSKKEPTIQLSPEEITQTDDLFSQYPSLAEQLHSSQDQAQIEAVLTPISNLSEAAQLVLIKTLAKANRSAAADILVAINAFSPQKEIRKEARRGLLRLESAKTRPHWTAPATAAPAAVQLATSNPPRFLNGFTTQSREAAEMQLILCWEQGYDYSETRLLGFLLDFWHDGVKDCFTVNGSKRQIDGEIQRVRNEFAGNELVPCTLAEGKRLLEEALQINDWRKVQPADDYRTQLPIINKLILQASDIGEDSGQSFITPALEEQEVVVNFIGAWSFGDYGLVYDLLTPDNALRANLTRDEWIQEHQEWSDEAHPARMQLKFVHEAAPVKSAIWLPNSAVSNRVSTQKELEVGWSLELIDTPLSGTLKDMPMGTVISKETGRHWFWTNFTLVKEQNVWRIQQLQDEGLALQALSSKELQKRIDDYLKAIENSAKQRENNPEEFAEEMSWRITQVLHFHDALITQLPQDLNVNEMAYNHAVLSGDSERIVTYLERLVQRFPQVSADTRRTLGATLVEWAFQHDNPQDTERRQRLIERAEAQLRAANTIDDSTIGHILLGEFLMSINHHDEAREELLKGQQLLPQPGADPKLVATIEAGLGNIAMRQEHIDEAITHFEQVVDNNPDHPRIYFSLGFAHRLLGHISQAEAYYQQALQREPEDIRLYSELTAIYMQRADGTKAQTFLEEAINRYPDGGSLHALLASVLSAKGDNHQALNHLKEAERLDPDSPLTEAVREQITAGRKRA
jgi:tetratricopeptide (TPR) repeat protein